MSMREQDMVSSEEVFEFEEILEIENLDVPPRKGRNKREKKRIHPILEGILYAAFTILTSVVLIVFVVQRTDVVGHSMEATLSDQDSLLVDKISYRIREPERFEIVVFRYLHKENTNYIKRIIGLPGETVQIHDSTIYINGKPLAENYGFESMDYAGLAADPITLGEGEYFLLGDNRNHSTDSRFEDVGNVTKEQIIGRAWLRIWPFDTFGFVE